MMSSVDALVAACLVPLAVAAVVSGLDDLVLDVAMAWRWLQRRLSPITEIVDRAARPSMPAVSPAGVDAPEKRIAVFLPLWQEEAVVGRMLTHNIGALRYSAYDFFVGVYANDPGTMEAVGEAESRFPNVHMAIVPHDGPTSKADCLNWIFQGMLAHEEACGVRFEIVVTHDAEDVIHPDGLRWINYHSANYDMIQIPVLPLPTPFHRLTHGTYCDEFAEYQTKDVPVRAALGGFLPSNGVGTGYTRRALDRLADSGRNRVFDPTCLTEDYDCGLRLHRLGFRQIFVPIRFSAAGLVATREYFPQRFRQAVRQRTRWVTGICLQGWERHGWRGGPAAVYWFWRDRKGLLGNPLSLFGNLITLYGLLSWAWCAYSGQPWGLKGAALGTVPRMLLVGALASQVLRTAVRTGCSARLYGFAFAAGVPLRTIWANWMNALATITAIFRYTRARLLREPQVWLKTAHTYPALSSRDPAPALSYQVLDARLIRREVARALPRHVVRQWKVLPFKVAEGQLFLATPELPRVALRDDLKRFTRLEVRFQLITEENYEALVKVILS